MVSRRLSAGMVYCGSVPLCQHDGMDDQDLGSVMGWGGDEDQDDGGRIAGTVFIFLS